jgi:hypothetical protein
VERNGYNGAQWQKVLSHTGGRELITVLDISDMQTTNTTSDGVSSPQRQSHVPCFWEHGEPRNPDQVGAELYAWWSTTLISHNCSYRTLSLHQTKHSYDEKVVVAKGTTDPAHAIRQIDVHRIPLNEVYNRFSTSPTQGLETAAVQRAAKSSLQSPSRCSASP